MEGKLSAQNTQIGRFSNPYLPIDIEFRMPASEKDENDTSVCEQFLSLNSGKFAVQCDLKSKISQNVLILGVLFEFRERSQICIRIRNKRYFQ